MPKTVERLLNRRDGRTIIHFDYDCFYASVVEAENPSLKDKPLAIQQKQIIVTCNYEARRRGLFKLQLITEARKICPEVIIVLGEDLTRFRDASKDLYGFLRAFSWNDRAERLGFDEVWLDVSDMVDYNSSLLNKHALAHSFFQLSQDDPTIGFPFDASVYSGHAYPETELPIAVQTERDGSDADELGLRLVLGSHLAAYIRGQLYEHKGYTATVGIATSKLLSKLVGNLHKPKSQTTLIPPYVVQDNPLISNVIDFMDGHDIGAVPGIGFKLALKLREYVFQRPAKFQDGLVYGQKPERVTVAQLREHPSLSVEMLERLLAGPGSSRDVGQKVFDLLHGIDDTEVAYARNVPRQISIEDSYIRLDTMAQVLSELNALSSRLLERMRLDLTESEAAGLADQPAGPQASPPQKWIGRPATLRLSTRPRMPLRADGTRARTFKRISRSVPMPSFVFNLKESVEAQTEKLVDEAIVPLFKKLHPEKSGWNLSLVNVAATDMTDTAGESRAAAGRDIQSMFKNQDVTLRDFQIHATQVAGHIQEESNTGSGYDQDQSALVVPTASDLAKSTQNAESLWQSDSEMGDDDDSFHCPVCKSSIPLFAQTAHARFHEEPE